MKKLGSLLLICAMLFTCAALAEEEAEIPMPDVDAAVLAALTESGEAPEQGYVGFYPIVQEESPDEDAVLLIGELYTAEAKLDDLSAAQRADVAWLDRRAAVTLGMNAEEGWTVTAVITEIDMDIEETAAAYLEENLRLYDASDCGYSIWYPVVLGELSTGTDTDGCSGAGGQTEDGLCSFFVGCRGNEQGLTTEQLIVAKKQQHEDLRSEYNSISGVLRLTWVENDRMTSEYWIVTEASVYHAQMTWDPMANEAFILYSHYMMNTFSADETGVG